MAAVGSVGDWDVPPGFYVDRRKKKTMETHQSFGRENSRIISTGPFFSIAMY